MNPDRLSAAIAAIFTLSSVAASAANAPLTFKQDEVGASPSGKTSRAVTTPSPVMHEMRAVTGPDGRVQLECREVANPAPKTVDRRDSGVQRQ